MTAGAQAPSPTAAAAASAGPNLARSAAGGVAEPAKAGAALAGTAGGRAAPPVEGEPAGERVAGAAQSQVVSELLGGAGQGAQPPQKVDGPLAQRPPIISAIGAPPQRPATGAAADRANLPAPPASAVAPASGAAHRAGFPDATAARANADPAADEGLIPPPPPLMPAATTSGVGQQGVAGSREGLAVGMTPVPPPPPSSRGWKLVEQSRTVASTAAALAAPGAPPAGAQASAVVPGASDAPQAAVQPLPSKQRRFTEAPRMQPADPYGNPTAAVPSRAAAVVQVGAEPQGQYPPVTILPPRVLPVSAPPAAPGQAAPGRVLGLPNASAGRVVYLAARGQAAGVGSAGSSAKSGSTPAGGWPSATNLRPPAASAPAHASAAGAAGRASGVPAADAATPGVALAQPQPRPEAATGGNAHLRASGGAAAGQAGVSLGPAAGQARAVRDEAEGSEGVIEEAGMGLHSPPEGLGPLGGLVRLPVAPRAKPTAGGGKPAPITMLVASSAVQARSRGLKGFCRHV